MTPVHVEHPDPRIIVEAHEGRLTLLQIAPTLLDRTRIDPADAVTLLAETIGRALDEDFRRDDSLPASDDPAVREAEDLLARFHRPLEAAAPAVGELCPGTAVTCDIDGVLRTLRVPGILFEREPRGLEAAVVEAVNAAAERADATLAERMHAGLAGVSRVDTESIRHLVADLRGGR